MSYFGDPFAALNQAYVEKVNWALSRGDEQLAAELRGDRLDEGLELLSEEREQSQCIGFARCEARRFPRFRRLWAWTAR